MQVFDQNINKKMKISVNWANLVLKWIVLYSTLVTVGVAARCYDEEGRCWRNALNGNAERVERAVNPCEWIVNNCKIHCYLGSSIYNASEEVQSIYEDRPECHSSGISLTLHSLGINNLTENWFTANINVIELELDLSNIYRIEDSPFKAEVFSKVENLTLKSLCPCELKRATFMGLRSLEALKITNIRFDDISDIEIGVLELVNDTLKTFDLIEQNYQDKEISINHFIGDNSAALISIEEVKIRYKLGSINHLSFTAIPNVKELDLSDCQIMNIGEFTFDPLGDNLQLLNLERNMLVTLPEGIFSDLNLSLKSEEPFLKILLNENQWDCEIGVEHLKQLLVDYSNFGDTELCDTSEMCPDPVGPDPPTNVTYPTTSKPTSSIPTTASTPTTTASPPTTTTSPPTTIPTTSATTTTTTTTTTTASPTTQDITEETTVPTNVTTELAPDFTEKRCFSSNEAKENVFIKRQIYQIDVSVNSNEVSVLIESNEQNLRLIWFGTAKLPNELSDLYHRNHVIDCITTSQNETKLRNLERDTPYTICLIKMADTTVSPLDCISFYYYKAEVNGVWLLKSSIPLVIKVNVGGLLVTIIFGIVIGLIFSFRMALHSSNNNATFIQETNNPNDSNDGENVSEECPRNGEQIYHAGFGYKRMSDSELPPLPPHPKLSPITFEIDENDENESNYYATVKY